MPPKKLSKSHMITKLKSAGVKGSLTRMRKDQLQQLMAEHAVEDHGSSHGIVAGSAVNTTPIHGGAAGPAGDIVLGSGAVDSMGPPERRSSTRPSLRIEPDPSEIGQYMSGGSFWGAVDKAGDLTATAGAAEAATGVGLLAVPETEAAAGIMKGVAALGREL